MKDQVESIVAEAIRQASLHVDDEMPFCAYCGEYVIEYDYDQGMCIECSRENAIHQAEAKLEMF